jgi:hypothetical protein
VNELHALAHRETLIPGKVVKEMNSSPKRGLGLEPGKRLLYQSFGRVAS